MGFDADGFRRDVEGLLFHWGAQGQDRRQEAAILRQAADQLEHAAKVAEAIIADLRKPSRN